VDSRCPYIDCQAQFEVAAPDKDRFPLADCPSCGRRCAARPVQLLDELALKRQKPGPQENALNRALLVVVLDDIRSLHNVGATFRTADAAGFGQVYLCGITGVPPRKEIAKVSLGAEEWLAYEYRVYITEVLTLLKKHGYTIVALERNSHSQSLSSLLRAGRLTTPLALVVGNEVTGVSPEALSLSDHICHLNMRGRKESLNVAVAYGVAAYFLAEALL
jgi:23S rRNA (guanosine2251-2'-O)-methyltransferase